jgi:hypothetical protein
VPTEDEDLLGRLEHALRPPEAEPSEAEIAALHRAVAEGASAPAVRRVWPRRAIAGAAAAAVLLFILSGAALPRPLRGLAHALRLPVDSVKVADAKTAVNELERALDENDQERAARASARLRQRLDALGEDDRQRIGRRADPLLQRARAPGGSSPAPGSPPPGGTVPSKPSTTTSSTNRRSTTTSSSTTTTARTATTRGTTSTTR